MASPGWSPRALEFFAGLEADNSRAYWQAHRAVYDAEVRAPLDALLAELEPEFGPGKVFRPARDVRFSRDKAPYKTHAAAVLPGPGGTAHYVQLSAAGLLVGGGCHDMARDQVARLREAVADEASGEALVDLVSDLDDEGWTLGGEVLRTAPRGYPRDHPRVVLLRHTALWAGREHAPGPWLATAAARDRVVEGWRRLAPLQEWLARHVGGSRLPPARR